MKKIRYIKITQKVDFFEMFQKIEQVSKTCFLLESLGEYGTESNYSYIGFDPEYTIEARKNGLLVNGKHLSTKNPFFSLRAFVSEKTKGREYDGGLVGYVGYDAINFIEPKLHISSHKAFPPFLFGLYNDGLILDKKTGIIQYFYRQHNRYPFIQKVLKSSCKEEKLQVISHGDTMTFDEYQQLFNSLKEEIAKGNTFQCEVGYKTTYTIKGNLMRLYERLRLKNPSPFMYYLKFDKKILLGASPELLLRVQKGNIETCPLAGTTKRGITLKEDVRLAQTLLSDQKERAEHSMLVDLHRNDIGKVAKAGSVQVKKLMEIKKFSHVQHISSEIVGKLKKGEDMFSSFAAAFPAGTLSGAPKIESMKIIHRLEKDPRGPYGGAVGYFGFSGDCCCAISIRSLYIDGNNAFAQTASGIVADSVAKKEYEEINRKLAAMKEVLSV